MIPSVNPSPRRRGVLLVEFIVTSFGLVTLTVMGIQLGLLVSRLQVTGEGARVAVRDASTKPGGLSLPPDASSLYVDPGVFDETFTAIDLGNLRFPSGAPLKDQNGDGHVDLTDQFLVLPAVHRLLRSQMVLDSTSIPGRTLLRFPGVLLQNAAGDLIVRIPDDSGPLPVLRRIIDPPSSISGDGTIQIQCHQWCELSTWFLGEAPPSDSQFYLNCPGGYAPVSSDLRAGSRHGMMLSSFAVGRKEIQ